VAGAGPSRAKSPELVRAQRYAYERGLCGDISPFGHLCTQWVDDDGLHKGRHQGVRVEETEDRLTATWGDP
jgi:hypothetical protein